MSIAAEYRKQFEIMVKREIIENGEKKIVNVKAYAPDTPPCVRCHDKTIEACTISGNECGRFKAYCNRPYRCNARFLKFPKEVKK